MMPLLAKAIVDVTGGPDGGHVMVDPPVAIGALYLFLVLLPLLLVLLFFFYKKKLQHQQILVAIEKGLPIADLIEKPRSKEVNWVRSLSAGIGFLFVGLMLTAIWVWLYMTGEARQAAIIWLIIPVVIAGLGLIYLFRGILQKNYEKQKQKEIVAPTQ